MNSSNNDPDPDGRPWYGGPDDSVMRTVMNMTPGLRLLVREFRRCLADEKA